MGTQSAILSLLPPPQRSLPPDTPLLSLLLSQLLAMSRPSLPSTLSQACPGPTLLSRLPTPSPLPRSPIVSPSTWSAARKYAKLPLPTSSTLSMSSTAPRHRYLHRDQDCQTPNDSYLRTSRDILRRQQRNRLLHHHRCLRTMPVPRLRSRPAH